MDCLNGIFAVELEKTQRLVHSFVADVRCGGDFACARREQALARRIMENKPSNLGGSNGHPNRRPVLEIRSLGGYRLLRRLGEGGMGAVYLGYKEGDDQPVAIKVLNEHLVESPGFVDRFLREARNGASLNHPNIVRTYLVNHDQLTNKYFLVLEFVDGPTTQTLLERLGRLSVGDSAYIVLGIARALEHAHSQQIIHRDIKPDNILLTPTGIPKLGDLGLAKKLDETSHLTATRQGFGTTPYMPYEQAMNARSVDGRSDIYALGATFYHLVTGALPFPGPDDLAVIERKKQGDYYPARFLQPSLPAIIDRLLSRMLAREPAQRFQTAGALIASLLASGLVPERLSLVDGKKPAAEAEENNAATANEPTRFNLEKPQTPSVRPALDAS
jgi:eukaryotic-like serine/threonine-protein kinase